MTHAMHNAASGFAFLIAVAAGPAVHAQSASMTLITSDVSGANFIYENGLYQSRFASTAGGFAVGSTSPNFGGSTMATASSTEYLHFANVNLTQIFTLPTFISSGRITLDFKGQAFAAGNAVAYIGYSIDKITKTGSSTVAFGNAGSSDLLGIGATAGSVKLSARKTFSLLGGESLAVNTQSLVEAGGGAHVFYTYLRAPGYATAFMDPVVTFSQAVPEPATWAMLIAGFGLVGGMQRRRRKALATVPLA